MKQKVSVYGVEVAIEELEKKFAQTLKRPVGANKGKNVLILLEISSLTQYLL